MATNKNISGEVLEEICKVIADTEKGMTNIEITQLLDELSIEDIDQKSTKWIRLHLALSEYQNKNKASDKIGVSMQRFISPKKRIDKNLSEERRNALNKRLKFIDIEITNSGEIKPINKFNFLKKIFQKTIPNKTIEPQTLTDLCKVIADTNSGLTGEEIKRYLQYSNIEDVEPNITKNKRLNQAFSSYQEKEKSSNKIWNFIQKVYSPIRYIDREEEYKNKLSDINKILVVLDFKIKDGILKKTNKRDELEENQSTSSETVSTEKKIYENKLNSIKEGVDDASLFHNVSIDNMKEIFGNRISNLKKEKDIDEGRRRIDIVFDNTDKSGFFYDLNIKHHVKCPKIIIECKNYTSEINNPEIDQLHGRLNDKRGRFGILVCRKIKNMDKLIQRCRDYVNNNGNYIIVLEDKDISTMLVYKAEGKESEIDNYMQKKLDLLIM